MAMALLGLGGAFAFGSSARAADSMAIQADGKVLLVGGSGGPGVVVRLDRGGTLDPRFGDGGMVRDPRVTGGFRSVAAMPSGEILVGGNSRFRPEGFPPSPLFARYLANGHRAASFGADGLVETTGDGRATVLTTGADGSAIAGITEWSRAPVRGGGVESIDGSAVEVGPTGALGPTLGRNPRGSVSDMDPLPDGSLAAVGAEREPPNSVQLAHFIPGSENGYDPAFGEGQGLVSGQAGTTPNAERIVEERAPALVVDQGRLLVVGGEAEEEHPLGGLAEMGHPLLARFSDAGTLDPGFGEGGVLKPTVPGLPRSLASGAAVQRDGRIVVAFTTVPSDYGPPTEENETQEAFLERFLPDGTLDSSFGSDGVVHVAPAGGNLLMVAEDVAVLPGGQIVLGGQTPDGKTLIAAQFLEDGALDTGFGEGGVSSVTPCPGKGCAPEVGRSSIKLKYLGGHRKPLLEIRLWVSGSRDAEIQSVTLNLPRGLRFRPKLATNAGATPEFGESQFTVWPGAASVEGLRNRYVKLEFGYGMLQVMRHRGRLSHRPIHLEVGFASCPCGYESDRETAQRLVLHIPRVRKR